MSAIIVKVAMLFFNFEIHRKNPFLKKKNLRLGKPVIIIIGKSVIHAGNIVHSKYSSKHLHMYFP